MVQELLTRAEGRPYQELLPVWPLPSELLVGARLAYDETISTSMGLLEEEILLVARRAGGTPQDAKPLVAVTLSVAEEGLMQTDTTAVGVSGAVEMLRPMLGAHEVEQAETLLEVFTAIGPAGAPLDTYQDLLGRYLRAAPPGLGPRALALVQATPAAQRRGLLTPLLHSPDPRVQQRAGILGRRVLAPSPAQPAHALASGPARAP